jgi:hypothetical protein
MKNFLQFLGDTLTTLAVLAFVGAAGFGAGWHYRGEAVRQKTITAPEPPPIPYAED